MNPYTYDRYEKYRPYGYRVPWWSAMRDIIGVLLVMAMGVIFIYYGMLFFGEDYCANATATYRSACLHRGMGGVDDTFRQPVREAK